MSSTQAERAGQNESTFREINEQLATMRSSDAETANYLCECFRAGCADIIQLEPSQYEHVRSEPTWFAVRPGHVAESVESVVERHPTHWIVAKHGEAATISRLTSSRDQ